MDILNFIKKQKSEEEQVIQSILLGSNGQSSQNEKIPILLWGSEATAEECYCYLKKHNVEVSGVFVDVPFSKQMFHDMDVMSLDEACEKFTLFNVFVANMYGYRSRLELKKSCKNVNEVFAIEKTVISGIAPIDFDYIATNSDLFSWSFNQLSDDLSRKCFLAYLNSKINKSCECLVPCFCENQYFCDDIIKLSQNEVFVDCGAYTGDTIRKFIDELNKHSIDSYDDIYAFEPDEENFSQLIRLSKDLTNIHCIKKGAWDEQTELTFNSEGASNSSVSDGGNTVIEVDTIDNVLNGKKATFIKMDIEGAEVNALRGAEQTILKYKPSLAICAYHKSDDLITLPKYIKSLCPDYKLYFRTHEYIAYEAVLYAVIQ